MKILQLSILFVVLGCVSELNVEEPAMSEVFKAVYTDKPVVIDGKLDDAIW